MNNHKLNLNQFPENYHLIAIHSDLDEFRLAFFLNKKLNIGLKRKNNDIYFAEQDANYSQYEYLDDTKYLKWIFFSNKSLVSEKNLDSPLVYYFADGVDTSSWIINFKEGKVSKVEQVNIGE